MTVALRAQHGALGSRLHLAEDDTWIAYAQWPDRASWERSRQAADSPDPEAQRLMDAAVAERLPPILLKPVIDLLEPVAAIARE